MVFGPRFEETAPRVTPPPPAALVSITIILVIIIVVVTIVVIIAIVVVTIVVVGQDGPKRGPRGAQLTRLTRGALAARRVKASKPQSLKAQSSKQSIFYFPERSFILSISTCRLQAL